MGETCLAQSCVKWERHAWHRAVLNGRDMLGTELYEMGETCLAQSLFSRRGFGHVCNRFVLMGDAVIMFRTGLY